MKLSSISPDVRLGKNVTIHGFVNLYNCTIGDNTRLGTFVEIQKHATVGANCKISSHSFICEGVTIEDNVFIGHNVTFINDRFPRAVNPDGKIQDDSDWEVVPTVIEQNVSVGSSVTILCGVRIGSGAIIGAGSLVLNDIPPNEIWAGHPAQFVRKCS